MTEDHKGAVPEGNDPAPADPVPGKAPEARRDPGESAREEEVALLLRLAGPRPAVDSSRAARVKDAVRASWRGEVARRRRRSFRWIAVPAAAAAAVVAMIALSGRLPRSLPGAGIRQPAILERAEGPLRRGDGSGIAAGDLVPPGTMIVTGAGGRAALRLSGGAALRIDSGTTLALLLGDQVDLKAGAVYLDTGGEKGISVRTPGGTVRDIGSQFVVRARDGAVVVSVREGAASLGLKSGEQEIASGTRLTAKAGEVTREAIAPYGPDWDWVLAIAPPFRMENRTLGEFLAWVSRETGRQIRFADPATAQEHASVVLHGSLEGLRPDEAPAAVLATCGLASRLEGEVLIIEAAGSSRQRTP
jgi:hypothetical protein